MLCTDCRHKRFSFNTALRKCRNNKNNNLYYFYYFVLLLFYYFVLFFAVDHYYQSLTCLTLLLIFPLKLWQAGDIKLCRSVPKRHLPYLVLSDICSLRERIPFHYSFHNHFALRAYMLLNAFLLLIRLDSIREDDQSRTDCARCDPLSITTDDCRQEAPPACLSVLHGWLRDG